MKKLLLCISVLFLNIILAETYLINIGKGNYFNAIKIKCAEGLVLNETGHCINTIPVCELPEVLNEAQDTCVDPISIVGWVYTTGDNCNGMRQANFDSNVYFARSKSAVYQVGLNIPDGYHWVTKSEYISLFNSSSVSTKNAAIATYISQCGLSGHAKSINGITQYVFLFDGGETTGMHAGNLEYHGITHTGYEVSSRFAGLVLYKDN
jgi:hypothetical protein